VLSKELYSLQDIGGMEPGNLFCPTGRMEQGVVVSLGHTILFLRDRLLEIY